MEIEFSKKVMKRLQAYFDIEAEVWSKSGKSRIDYVIRDKEHGKYFGVEFKDYDEKKKGMQLGDHIIQSMRYAVSEFKTIDGYKQIPIIICHPISYHHLQAPLKESIKIMQGIYKPTAEYFHDRHEKDNPHHTVNGMLGAFGIGEMRTKLGWQNKQYIYFSFSNKPLWEETGKWDDDLKKYVGIKGVHLKNYEFQINKQFNYTMK